MSLNKYFIAFFTTIALLVFAGNKVQAEEIKLTKDVINAEISKDSSMNVEEDLTFKFSGKYNGVYKDISYDKAEGISDITVSEISGADTTYKEVKSASNGDKGVYTIEKNSSSIRVKIYSPSKDEAKTYRITYKISGAVKKYNDIGEFYWKFIGKENETLIEKLQINVVLPEGANRGEMKAFGHGPLDGRWQIVDDRTITFSAANVSSGRYVEVRTIFPKELLSDTSVTINENKFEEIMAEENKYINEKLEKAKQKEKLVNNTKYFSLLMSIISALIALYIFVTRKRYNRIDELVAMRDISTYNPVILSYNAKRNIEHNDLLASIFELVRRGYLTIEGNNDEYRIVRIRKADQGVLRHEGTLMKWLIDKIGDGDCVTLEDIKYYNEKKPDEFGRQFNLWKNEIKLEADSLDLFDKKAENIKMSIVILEIIFLAAAVFFIIIGNINALISIAASSLVFVLLSLINTRTLEGNILYILWERMKRSIRNLNESKIEQWDNNASQGELYLVYAVAMGLRHDLVKRISPDMISNSSYYTQSNFWMFYYMMNNDNFNNAFDPPSQNTESSGDFSSSDSSGGFDSGGGGGAGGF